MILLGDSQEPLDLLAFAPHPDDAEIGLAGVLCREASAGRKVGIADLSRGELSSNGTVESRLQESLEASRILGTALRENLELADGGLEPNEANLRAVIEAIRRHRPRVVCAPYWQDRHPDHGAASRLITEAAYRAGLAKWPAGGDPYRPERVVYYFINGSAQPSFLVDVSPFFERKLAALRAHLSQFQRAAAAHTPINDPRYLEAVESRERYFGSLLGVRYAEGFVYQGPLSVPLLSGL